MWKLIFRIPLRIIALEFICLAVLVMMLFTMFCLLKLALVVVGGPFLIGRSIWMFTFVSFRKTYQFIFSGSCHEVSQDTIFHMYGPVFGGIYVIGVLLIRFCPRIFFPPALLHASGYEM